MTNDEINIMFANAYTYTNFLSRILVIVALPVIVWSVCSICGTVIAALCAKFSKKEADVQGHPFPWYRIIQSLMLIHFIMLGVLYFYEIEDDRFFHSFFDYIGISPCGIIFIVGLLGVIFSAAGLVDSYRKTHKYRKKEAQQASDAKKKTEEIPAAEPEAQTAPSPQEDEPYLCSISALGSKHDADVHGIDYAFGQAEYEERNKIRAFILHECKQGLYSCELDFPVSQRSLEWLRYSGFEVSQTEGKTKVSWGNAKI